MKPTYEQAAEAARIIRQYMNGEKVCEYYCGKEADEISRCDYILQEWTHDGELTMEEVNKEFLEEFHYAHRVDVDNYHAEEASLGML